MPRRRIGALTADVGDSGIGGLFNEPGDVKHYGVARRKRVWRQKSNRKKLKKVLGLAAKFRKYKGLSAREALKKAWTKVKRKGFRSVTTAYGKRRSKARDKYNTRRYHRKPGRKGPGY